MVIVHKSCRNFCRIIRKAQKCDVRIIQVLFPNVFFMTLFIRNLQYCEIRAIGKPFPYMKSGRTGTSVYKYLRH